MANAVLYVVENGCKWRSLSKEYADWHVIYVRVNRWAKKGVLQAAFLRLQQLEIIGSGRPGADTMKSQRELVLILFPN